MKRIPTIVFFVCECAFAQVDYNTMLTNMVNALEQPKGTLNVSFTNQLAVCAGSMTNVFCSANVNLVRAISLVDVAEEEMSSDVLLPQAVSICSNLLTSTDLSSNAWQRGVAGVVLSGIYSFDGKRSDACNVITNDVVAEANGISLADDIYLWNAIANHLDVEGLSVQDALRCYAAIAILVDDSGCDVSFYTNGLPASVLVKIRDITE